jgi:hypothetical protein
MNSLIKLDNGGYTLVQDAIDSIVAIETQVKTLKEAQERYKEILFNAMEEVGLKDLDTPELKITRKLATTKETFDSKAFREEHPDLYDEYVKISDVKGSITIKVK